MKVLQIQSSESVLFLFTYWVLRRQCDQMARLFSQYLAIFSIECLTNDKKIHQTRFKILANTLPTYLQKLPNTSNFLPKCFKFCQIWSHCASATQVSLGFKKSGFQDTCFNPLLFLLNGCCQF